MRLENLARQTVSLRLLLNSNDGDIKEVEIPSDETEGIVGHLLDENMFGSRTPIAGGWRARIRI